MKGLRARHRSYDGPNLPAYSTLDDLFALIPGRRNGARPTSAVVPVACRGRIPGVRGGDGRA